MKGWLFGSRGGASSPSGDQTPTASRNEASIDPHVHPGTGSTTSPDAVPERPFPGTSTGRSSIANDGGLMSAFHNITRGAGAQDAEMERRVSVAARNLGDGVLTIVQAARGTGRQQHGGVQEWKSQLLTLLGGADDQTGMFSQTGSDIDVLLENCNCDKFVLRCVENELPPNLIHCLRLLRVLELQHANSQQETTTTQSISKAGASKVTKLLCLLCKDPSVGEQLRPHLFGLLALSGASYPASGTHVASAASSVIVAFSEFCLSTSLVWFLHDRRMITHMTDDIKELIEMTEVAASTTAALCLYGEKAEGAGLWVVALRTVVHLVVFSCKHQCVELLNDFDVAGGYHVLCHAIANSNSSNGKQLMELVTLLACCKTESDDGAQLPRIDNLDSGQYMETEDIAPLENENEDKEISKFVTNPAACDIIEDLMVRSVPLLKEYDQVYEGERPDISTEESLRELSEFSLATALNVRFVGGVETNSEFDLPTELLVTTLQLYSDHSKNYGIVEERHNILAYYLLALPTFEDIGLKVLILKTLEFVCTGVAGTDAIRPLAVTSEIFFSLCKSLLKGAIGIELDSEEETRIYESLLMDAEMMCATIEKLIEFDERVSEIMVGDGVLTLKLSDVFDLVMQTTENRRKNLTDSLEVDGRLYTTPPPETPLDRVFSVICRVLKLVVFQLTSAVASRMMSTNIDESTAEFDEQMRITALKLNEMLLMAVKELGDSASDAALGVFESLMVAQASSDILIQDMDSIILILHDFAETAGRLGGIDIFCDETTNVPKRKLGTGLKNEISPQLGMMASHNFNPHIVLRGGTVLSMLKNVLDVNDTAQDAFRTCGGFECLVRLIHCLEGVANNDNAASSIQGASDCNETGAKAVVKLLESTFGLLSAAVGRSRKQSAAREALSLQATDVLMGNSPSQPSVSSAIANNRIYLHRKNFYVELGIAIAGTGILNTKHFSLSVLNLTLAYMDPSLQLPDPETDAQKPASPKSTRVHLIRNPDASRLFMKLAVSLPSTDFGLELSKRALGEMLRLCGPEMAGSTLPQLASCGLCWSITNPKEFAPMLEDRSHHLYSRFVLLLRRLAAFSMSYTDFIALIRCIAGPMLIEDGTNTSKISDSQYNKRIQLPFISSSVRTPVKEVTRTETWKSREDVFCSNLETLCIIAERGDRTPRCELGGDNLNTVSVYMHETKVEERLYAMAEEGRMKFLEVKCIDNSAQTSAGLLTAGLPSPTSSKGEDRIWSPLAASGFTYSCWLRLKSDKNTGSLFILDLSSPPKSSSSSGQNASTDFLSVWFDIATQSFNVLTSTSRAETCFPVSPLRTDVWHHILLAYLPPKRPLLSRKAVLGMFVDGRPLEAEVRVESVNLPPNSRFYIGVPNPFLASTSLVTGALPCWDLGPTLMCSTLLSNRDATAIFAAGPDFQGMFWGDRPQRLSLTATATTMFAMLAKSGEQGSVAGALRRRGVPEVEAAGYVMRERGVGNGHVQGPDSDSLDAVNLLCGVATEHIVFGYRAAASSASMGDGKLRQFSSRLANVARVNTSNEAVSSDAIVYGKGGVISPHCFADNVQWIGGPNVLMPIVNAARSARSLALALGLVRESVRLHPPNLEMLQAGGGYRVIGALLRQKRIMDENVLDQCFSFAVHGFNPVSMMEYSSTHEIATPGVQPSWPKSDRWVFADLDAMKYLLLNHQVWDMKGSGPALPLRLLSFLNGMVAQHSPHKAFNSRRLHLLGIVRWTLHLMLEAAELFSAGDIASSAQLNEDETYHKSPRHSDGASGFNPGLTIDTVALSNGWYVKAPSVTSTAVGGDPDNALLGACKTLLRRVLTFMLTPGDLEAIADAAIYTVSIKGPATKLGGSKEQNHSAEEERLLPGPVARVYLLRLIEELVVDGVNEIVGAGNDKKTTPEGDGSFEPTVRPHAGGGASISQSYLGSSMMTRKKKGGNGEDFALHPKHHQAQAFLQAFGGVLTPVWFACLLEGCHEEASASAVLRLMILMLQSSPLFAKAFEEAGGFAPLVLSIPKFSTCPNITMSMLSQLLHAPILHLPCFGNLDALQLCEVFDAESDSTELIMKENMHGGPSTLSDPSCGIFALLAECLGRNIQLASCENDLGRKARQTNEAVLQLLTHRHRFSSAFQDFCQTPEFLEPLAQALCLVHDEKIQRMQQQSNNSIDRSISREVQTGIIPRTRRRGSLVEVQTDETPTERFVGLPEEEAGISGIGMVQLLHLVVSHAVLSGPLAAPLVSALFRSFPIHASPEQVEAFHLVLIEHCQSVVEDALQRGDPIALANCIGVSSVLLDRLMAGFFTSEPVLETVKIILSVLECLTTSSTYASRILGNPDQVMLTADAAHLSRLICLKALQRSQPMGPYDEGDPDLKLAVLQSICTNMKSLMIVPSASGNQGGSRRQSKLGGGANVNPAFQAPLPGSRLYPFFQSASLARCCPPHLECMYRDLTTLPEPDRAFIVAIMDELHSLLVQSEPEMRDRAVSIVIDLLKEKRGIMSELLIAEVMRGDRVETLDIMNRGGFGALLVAHEVASCVENVSTVRRGNEQVPKGKYASFFGWLESNEDLVDAVFTGIHAETIRLFPESLREATTPEEAIENEQKVMLLKLTSQDSSDRTILGGLERAELAQKCYDKTAETHSLWQRQGFDDLSSGAMRWKFLLRQLKGSCTIWEGGVISDDDSPFSKVILLSALVKEGRGGTLAVLGDQGAAGSKNPAALETISRWKLDLTEGYERQRRRLLPNYEFHGLYNLDEKVDHGNRFAEEKEDGTLDEETVDSAADASLVKVQSWGREQDTRKRDSSTPFGGDAMEATAAILKDLNLGRARNHRNDEVDFFDMGDMDVDDETAPESISTAYEDSKSMTESTTATDDVDTRKQAEQKAKVRQRTTKHEKGDDHHSDEDDSIKQDNVLASSYDLITGLLQAGDWPEKSYNINRCTGIEVRKGLLLWCRDAFYIIDGFEQIDGEGLEGKINRIEKESTSFYINLRPQGFKATDENAYGEDEAIANSSHRRSISKGDKAKETSTQGVSDEATYQHRSQRVAFSDLYSIFRRRHNLQQVGLEFFDVHRSGTLLAFSDNSEREEVLQKVLNAPLPNSIFNHDGYTSFINYKRFMNNWKNKVVTDWVNRKMTNFEFLMHLNSFAGRSYNDLTQYPVFPWVIADYDSEELDLNDPATFRDLSKPMGAQADARAESFRDRYEALAQTYMTDDDPPPFHYGTHYSCAAYVVGYLMRLEPFSRLALSIQGGHFDVADRLFHNIGFSWRSASSENLQDVRELIPEFFYLPEFLENSDSFDFGVTQTGKTVHDVTLPAWAKGCPKRFVRLNRLALESDYVSQNLHHWVDLIFGYKQRGPAGVAALNTFVHVTYEGEVDLETMEDPVQRESTIAQIQNFGQTPSRLERKPFAQRIVANAFKDKNIDFSALGYLAPLTAPYCIVGAPSMVHLSVSMEDTCKLGMVGQSDSSVGDLCIIKGQLVGVGRTCTLIIPKQYYFRYGGPNNGVSVHIATKGPKNNKLISIHDGMHRAPISVAKASRNGMWLVTGCFDSTVRVWRFDRDNLKIHLRASLCGHEGGQVTCIDISTQYGTIVTGCVGGNVLLWDLRTLTFLRKLRHPFKERFENDPGIVARYPAVSVSINHKNGNILTLVGSHLSVFNVNGGLICTVGPGEYFSNGNDRPSCVAATDCPEWVHKGVALVSGHMNGDVKLWRLDYEENKLTMCHRIVQKPHSCPITVLRCEGERQDTLLIGDRSGKMTECKTIQLEDLNQTQLAKVVQNMRDDEWNGDIQYEGTKVTTSEGGGLISLLTGAE